MLTLRFQLGIFLGLIAFGRSGLVCVNPTNPPSAPEITFVWDPSPDLQATGYYLNWGLDRGQCTNRFNFQSATNATLSGVVTYVFYYFNVTAHDAFGVRRPTRLNTC